MESLKSALFENPLYIYILLGVTELVLLIIWRMKRTRRAGVHAAIPIILTAAVFLTSWLVVTDREQIMGISAEIAHALQLRDVQTVRKHISADFAGPYLNSNLDADLTTATSKLDQMGVKEIKLKCLSLDITDHKAIMHIKTWFHNAKMPIPIVVEWDVQWRKGQSWKICTLSEPQASALFQ